MIEVVTSENNRQAAEIHAVSWRESHRDICSPEFIALHTTERQMGYLQDQIGKGCSLYILIDAGKPKGIVSIRGNLIGDLYVLPEEQGKGYGTELLRFAMAHCISTPSLWVLNHNQRAISLYERMGFRLSGARHVLSDSLSEVMMCYTKRG